MSTTCMNNIKETFLQFLLQQLTLSEKEKLLIRNLPIFQEYSKGTQLYTKGDITDSYYLVIEGGIRTHMIVEGNEISTEFYTKNEALIPASTIMKTPSDDYATCFEDSVLIVTSEDIEHEVFQHIPEFASICRKYSEHILAKKQKSIDMYRTLTPEQRYISLTKERPELIQKIPQYQLASYLGIRPESLSRIRKRLVKKY